MEAALSSARTELEKLGEEDAMRKRLESELSKLELSAATSVALEKPVLPAPSQLRWAYLRGGLAATRRAALEAWLTLIALIPKSKQPKSSTKRSRDAREDPLYRQRELDADRERRLRKEEEREAEQEERRREERMLEARKGLARR